MRTFFVALVLACTLAGPAQEASPTAPQPNSILNLYDAFGYQKKGTVLVGIARGEADVSAKAA